MENNSRSTIQFWLPDPDDIDRVLQLLEICGYTDKFLALEDAAQSGEQSSVLEITIKRRQIATPHAWREEVNWIEDHHEGLWQA